MKSRLAWCFALLSLTACDSKKIPITGTRVPVVSYENMVKPDAEVKDTKVLLPLTEMGREWHQEGGEPDHFMAHASLKDMPIQAWDVSIGSGNGSGRLLSTPIVAKGIVYTLDTEGNVTATDASNGLPLWGASIAPENRSGPIIGGGLAFGDDKVYVTSPYAEVLALDAKKGNILWRYTVQSPVRAAPTYSNGRLYVLTISNQLEVLDASKGTQLWEHAGITETAGLLGTASPAVSKGIVIVTYSSGEIFALKADNGQQLWSETLSSTRRPDSLSAISHIRALPVIDQNKVFIIGHNQKMAAYDLLRGDRVWERSIGGTRTPAVVGDYIFMLNSHNELICLTKDYGQVVWVQKLPFDQETPTKVLWQGPVVAGNKLYLVNTTGGLATFDPGTGRKLSERPLNAPVSISPIIAHETLYVLTDEGRLIALR